MKVNKRAFGQIILFCIVMLLSILLFSNTSYIPYSRPATYARYEGFSEGVEDPSGGAVDPSGNAQDGQAPPSILQSLFGSKKEGFARLLPTLSPSSELSGASFIDKFSQVSDKSDGKTKDCVSSGLSNSKGPLCLTPELINLLQTRGNNM